MIKKPSASQVDSDMVLVPDAFSYMKCATVRKRSILPLKIQYVIQNALQAQGKHLKHVKQAPSRPVVMFRNLFLA